MLAFGAADTHGHLLTVGDRAAAGDLAHAVQVALHAVLPSPSRFLPAEITPVVDHFHLVNAFRYVQRNAAHHGVQDPLATEASSVHDLLGLRYIAPWLAPRVRAALPRTHREELTDLLGLPTLALVAEPSSTTLPLAAAAIIGQSKLQGEGRLVVNARVAAVALVKQRWRSIEIARALEVGLRTVQDYATREADPNLVDSLNRQLAWMTAVVKVADPLLSPNRRTR